MRLFPGAATEFDRGYYQDPEEVAMLEEDDGTATRFDRGYYQDPDGLQFSTMRRRLGSTAHISRNPIKWRFL